MSENTTKYHPMRRNVGVRCREDFDRLPEEQQKILIDYHLHVCALVEHAIRESASGKLELNQRRQKFFSLPELQQTLNIDQYRTIGYENGDRDSNMTGVIFYRTQDIGIYKRTYGAQSFESSMLLEYISPENILKELHRCIPNITAEGITSFLSGEIEEQIGQWRPGF